MCRAACGAHRLRGIGEQDRPAQRIELLGFPLASLGVDGLLLFAIGKMAGHQRGGEKGE